MKLYFKNNIIINHPSQMNNQHQQNSIETMDQTVDTQRSNRTLNIQLEFNVGKKKLIEWLLPKRQRRAMEDSSYAFGYDESDHEWYLYNHNNGKAHHKHILNSNRGEVSEHKINQYCDNTEMNIPFANNCEGFIPFQEVEQSEMKVRKIAGQSFGDLHCQSALHNNNQMTPSCQNPIAITQNCGHSTSRAISLPASHIPRTLSEQQLRDDTAAAEWRDLCMFHRLVGGIRERQVERWSRRSSHSSSPDGMECDRLIEQSIANIVRKHQDSSREYTEDNHFFCEKKIDQLDADFQFSYDEQIPYYDDQVSDDNEDVFTMDF